MLDLLQKLIDCKPVTEDIPAVNRATAVMHDFLATKGVPCVIETDEQGRNVLFASTRPGKQHKLLLNAHLDVVPPMSEDQWTIVQDGDFIRGRGVSDCQGSAVVIAQLLVDLLDQADVSAIFTANEENGGSTTRMMVERGYVPTELGIILDGSSMPNIAIAQKGIQVLKLTAHGKGGHSSRPWDLDNPIVKLVEGFHKLNEIWKNPTSDNTWADSMAPCIISGGTANNQIPDDAEMIINFRYIAPGGDQKIIDLVKNVTGLDVEPYRSCEPVVSDPEAPAIQALRNALEKAFPESSCKLCRMDGATDARHFWDVKAPIAITGLPGGGAHSADEFLNLKESIRCARCLTDFAKSFR